MLQTMRNLAQSWLAKGVMLFLMVSFSIWGIGDIFRGNPLQKMAAKVGDDTITVQQLDRAFARSMAEARQRIPNLSPQQAKQLGLLDKTLDAEIKRDLIDQDVKRQGIVVPTSSIIEMLSEQPNLRNPDGTFKKDLFARMLVQQGMTEDGFMAQQKIQMERELLAQSASGSHYVPQTAVDAWYKARAQKRILDVVTIDASKITGIPAADDKALHDYYDGNPALFSAPEYRGMTVASLSTDSLMPDVTISDDDLQKGYDAKKDQLSHPEQRDIVQVVLPDEAKAKELASHAFVAHDLNAAATADKVVAVPMNAMSEKQLMPELAKAVFAMHEGDISDPVKTQLGWHVVQVKKIIPAGTPSFAEVKDTLRDEMRRDQAIDLATRAVNKLDDQLAAGHSLDDIADELKLRVVKIAKVDEKGITPDGKNPEELPGKDKVLKDAFAQNAGDTSPIIDDKAGNYYVVRTDAIIPSGVKPFDQVKGEVAEAWKAHEQLVKAKAEADKIAQALRDGKPASDFASQEGVSVRVANPISQLGDVDTQLPKDIALQGLTLKKGETTTAEIDGKEIVARLSKIVDVDSDAAKDDTRKNRILGDFKNTQSEELFSQYIEYLYQVFPVKKNTDLLNQMNQQGG